jgi:hypothetical protein
MRDHPMQHDKNSTKLLEKTFSIGLIVLVAVLFGLPARAQVNIVTQTISSNVTLVWEAQSYVPPFYKGRALAVDGGDVNILAFPPASLGNSADLTYIWKIDGRVDNPSSGLGRSFFRHRPDIFGGAPLIVVDVYRDGNKAATGALRVPQVKPQVLVYPALPLAGILFGNRARSIDGEEITLEAYPLFFGVQKKSDPALTYRWSVNDVAAQNPLGNAGRLVMRSEEGGTVNVEVSVANARNILESAKQVLSLTFEE